MLVRTLNNSHFNQIKSGILPTLNLTVNPPVSQETLAIVRDLSCSGLRNSPVRCCVTR